MVDKEYDGKVLTEKVELLVSLAKVYDKDLDKDVIQIMYDALSDMDLETMKSVVNWTVRHSRYMPTVADMYECADRLREERRMTAQYGYDVHKVVSWLEKNRNWKYSDGWCSQQMVDEALVSLGMEPGSVDSDDV